MRRSKLSIFWLVLLILFFSAPYLLLLANSPSSGLIRMDWAFSAFWTSVKQSIAVVTVCILFSFLCWRGMFALSLLQRNFVKKMLRAPILLPSVFTILIGFQLFEPFPFGLMGITLLFLLTYLGFFFAGFVDAIESQFLSQVLIQKIYGIKSFEFDLKVLLPQMKSTILYLGLIVFAGCFSSLGIPMVASGGKSINFELFIYEAVFLQNNWSAAIGLSLVQVVLLYMLSNLILASGKKLGSNFNLISDRSQNGINLQDIFQSSKMFLVFPALYLISYFGIFLYKFAISLIQFSITTKELQQISQGLGYSLIVFVVVALFSLLFGAAVAYRKYLGSSNRFILIFLNPSSVVIGLSFFLITSSSDSEWIRQSFSLLKLSMAIFTVYGVAFYVTFLNARFEHMDRQFVTARLFGLSYLTFLKTVLFPQIRKSLLSMLSLLLLVILTEFAITAVLGLEFQTLGSILYSYASSYRFYTAVALAGIIFSFWGILTLLVARVFGKNGD